MRKATIMHDAIRRASIIAAALIVSAAGASIAHAAPCAGLTDVEDTSLFCPNVEWMKNRGITLGCTANLYCPGEDVSRIAMAAFLRRLGDALTPVHLTIETSGNTVNIDVDPVVCQTEDHTVVGAPRTAHGNAVLTAGQGSGSSDFAARYVESTNGGASWTAVSPNHAATGTASERPTVNVVLPPRDLVVGTTYRYALRLSRVPGSATTADPGSYLCSVRVLLENRNSATPPRDAGS